MSALRWLVVVCLALGSPAYGGEEIDVVALVPLDGAPGTSSRDMSVVTAGLARAMGRDGRLVVVAGEGLVQRLTADRVTQLQEARNAFDEGRTMLAEGDPDLGLGFLYEAVAAHERAGSPVVRREEMADAAFVLANALLDTDQTVEAQKMLARSLRLLPDYLDTQIEANHPRLRSLAEAVEAELSSRPPRRLSSTGALALAQDLNVDHVIHGVVLADGSLKLTVWSSGEARYTLSRPGPFRAPRLSDPSFGEMAGVLVAACLGEEIPELSTVEPSPEVPVTPPPPPPPQPPAAPRKKGGALVAGLITASLAAGGAAAAYVVVRQRGPAPEAWQLQLHLVR
ncbi:MAG: hypothetical protein ACI9MC_002280 [Kiritimatiellia bacterium]|jgi:hypothetical protein